MILPLDKGKRKFVRMDCKIQKIKKCHLKKRKKVLCGYFERTVILQVHLSTEKNYQRL